MAAIKKGKRIKIGRLIDCRFSFKSIFLYTILFLLVCFTMLPLIYMVSTAFKPMNELFLYPPRFFVKQPTLKNFSDLTLTLSNSTVPFSRYIFNSVLISVATVVLTVFASSMAAFALSKFHLPGGNVIFGMVVASLMFSAHVTQIPAYLVVNSLGMVDTYWALIIPKIAVGFNLFLIKQFLDEMPDALLEAAKIDGAGTMTLYWKIVLPFLKPAIATLVVFSFVSNWNDYFSALIFITSDALKPLTLALQTISSGGIGRAGATSAATMLMTLPTIIIFVIMQKKVMSTMAASGIKG